MKSTLGKKGDPARYPSDAVYLYHVTTADRLVGISELGLRPGLPSRWEGEYALWSAGKVFFTLDLWVAGQFIDEEMERDFYRSREIQMPVLLRVQRRKLKHAREDMLWFNVYVERPVNPDVLEVWVPWEDRWVSMADAVEEFRGFAFRRVDDRAEFEKVKRDFFEKDWVLRDKV